MSNPYRLVYHPNFRVRMKAESQRAQRDPRSRSATIVAGLLDALAVLREGREADFAGERLSFSPNHYDLRDCAEIKFAVFQEFTRAGKPRGPSHRMIYREYEPHADDPRPIREILAFEHRKDGLPYTVAAAAVGRQKGRAADALKHLPAPRPVIGPNKDPQREVKPPRLPLPPDLATALATAGRRRPGRSAEPVAVAPSRVNRTAAVHRDRH